MSEEFSLKMLVKDFATGLETVDASCGRAHSRDPEKPYDEGIGPHTEPNTVEFIVNELQKTQPDLYRGYLHTSVPYPRTAEECDLCYGHTAEIEWAIEVKMFRLLGNNGRLNDFMFLHLLSPYEKHRSALTDCKKLLRSTLGKRKAILIYGYEVKGWPLETAINAFEVLALSEAKLSDRHEYPFSGLRHKYHREGKVFAWELFPK